MYCGLPICDNSSGRISLSSWRVYCRNTDSTWQGAQFRVKRTSFAKSKRGPAKSANLTFHGKVPYLEIGRLFDRARLVANTSEVEGFPNTFLQAWVRGVPVVTLFDPDHLVTRESLGTSHESVSDMVCGLRALLESTDMYGRVSANAIGFMEQWFGQDKVLGPYLDALTGAKCEMPSGQVLC